MTSPVERVWNRVRDWWSSEAAHLVHDFLPDGGPDLIPYQSYLRMWLSEMFLAKDRDRAADRYPAVQASVRLSFGGSPNTTFSTLSRPPAGQEGPGVRRDVKLSELLPYCGGTVDIQASLLDVAGADDLKLALDIVSDFSSLLTPPLSTVAGVATRVASGISRVDEALDGAGRRPVLAVERSLAGTALRSGHLVVIRTTPERLPPGSFTVADGRLHRVGQDGRWEPMTGLDYLVVRLESMVERDDWRFPEWDALIGQAMAAQLHGGQGDRYEQLRTEVLARIVTSPDLTPTDRRRVAKLVKDELDAFSLGAAGEARPDTIADLVSARGLPHRLTVDHLSAADLLAPAGDW